MSKAKKMDTVFMEFMPSSVAIDEGWGLVPEVDSSAVLKKMARYMIVSVMFLGITLAVFYTLFSWLVNQ